MDGWLLWGERLGEQGQLHPWPPHRVARAVAGLTQVPASSVQSLPPTVYLDLLFLPLLTLPQKVPVTQPQGALALSSPAGNPTAGTQFNVASGPLLLALCHSEGDPLSHCSRRAETADWPTPHFPTSPFTRRPWLGLLPQKLV